MASSKRFYNGGSCSAFGCTMRRGTNLLSEVKMFRFPRDPVRRDAWSNALKRENWTANDNSLICNAHFLTGQPSKDPQHPDYIPSIFSFKAKDSEKMEKNIERYNRSTKRMKRDSSSITETSSSTIEDSSSNNTPTEAENFETLDDASPNMNNAQNVATQTDICGNDMTNMEKKMKILEEENSRLKQSKMVTQTYNQVVSTTKVFKFYTGLENMGIFNSILTFLLAVWKPPVKVSLKPCEQLLLVLMKLRLGLLNQDLACRFEIGLGGVSAVFHSWIDVMYINMSKIIIWPSKAQVKKNLPECFRDVCLENVRCTIDCTELFIEKPHNFKARAQTYSNYKHHNTLKILVGITPCGVVSFVSRVWGGRVSDRQLTIQSGFLNLLEKGDVLLADRGFKIADLLAEKGAELIIPSSTRNKTQLSEEEVRLSRNMSKVRVHVERAIRKLKVFKILDSNLPISLIKKNEEEEIAAIDKIVTVLCALINLGNPLIKK